MKRLLRAGLSRSFQSTLLRLCLLIATATVLFAGGIIINTAQKAYVESPAFVEDVLVIAPSVVPFLSAAFIALLLGAEYEQSTIRNKLTVGHMRLGIYLSALVVCAMTTLAILAVTLLGGGLLGAAALGDWLLEPGKLMLVVAVCTMACIALSTLFAAVALNLPNRAIAVTVLLVLLWALFVASAYLDSALCASEFSYEYVVFTSEGPQYGPLVPNPEYISGTKRAVYELLRDLLPTSQLASLSNSEFELCTPLWLVSSLPVTLLSAVAGYLGFRRRDIK